MADNFSKLEKEYNTTLDSALVAAILSDFDLSTTEGVVSARETLDAIKAASTEAENSSFDPSGTSSSHHDSGRKSSIDQFSQSQYRSEDTESSSISEGINSFRAGIDYSGDPSIKYGEAEEFKEYDNLDENSKLQALQEMFPGTSTYSISHTLKKCGGHWNRALEELLNHAFFDEESEGQLEDRIIAKGVDGFSEEYNIKQSKRKNRKNKKFASIEALEAPGRLESPSPWEEGKRHIEWVSSRMKLPQSTISSIYHQNRASLPKTIIAVLDLPPPKLTVTSDASIHEDARELGREFPTISPSHTLALVQLTHPSSATAHELAKAIVTPQAKPKPGLANYDITPMYSPLVLPSDDLDETWQTVSRLKSASDSRTSSGTSTPDPSALANSYGAKAQSAFASASVAWRRGKSDRLMAGAAGYYSQVGRDMTAKRLEATSEAADNLVDAQSSDSVVDLHGVSVKDAMRIARQKTQSWWSTKGKGVMGFDGRMGLAESRERSLTIVTGVGRHSEAGRAKIGPAVGRMLLQEGWKFEVGNGVIFVTGKKR